MTMESLMQNIKGLLHEIGYENDSGIDCSEVAELIKKRFNVGRVCTIRAFARVPNTVHAPGVTFQVQEQQWLSEPYIYHTVLWYEHGHDVYIIDGTSKFLIRTLQQFAKDLIQHNSSTYNGNPPQFVFYKGCIDDVYPRDITYFKEPRFYVM